MELYPRRQLLRKTRNERALIKTEEEMTLFDSLEGPVRLNKSFLQLGSDEVILDALAEPVKITFGDWVMCVITFSIYYFVVVRDLKHYKSAHIVTDRRYILLHVRNPNGFKPDVKYIQLSNCWFFHHFGCSAVRTSRSNSCICTCLVPPEYELLLECGPGTLQILPYEKHGKERIIGFFSHFFGYYVPQLVRSDEFPPAGRSGSFADGLLLPNEEVLACVTGHYPYRKGCLFGLSRCCSCGFSPAETNTSFLASSHRFALRYDASNGCVSQFVAIDFFCSLQGLSGFQLLEAEFSFPCSCMACIKRSLARVGVAIGKDESWTLDIAIWKTKMSDPAIQQFSKVVSFAQDTFERQTGWRYEQFLDSSIPTASVSLRIEEPVSSSSSAPADYKPADISGGV